MSRAFGSCAAVRGYLNAFADGELRGNVLRGVSHHVEVCEACAEAVVGIGELGNMLRHGLAMPTEPQDLAGLADGVVSRIRAEDRESWHGIFERATDDLHWVLVGVGSVVAAFMSALVVSVVVQSGLEQRSDSLAALLNTLATSPPAIGRARTTTGDVGALGMDDVQLASRAEVNDHLRSWQLLSKLDERDVEILVAELRRVKFVQLQDRRMSKGGGHQIVMLFSTTEVRGKIL